MKSAYPFILNKMQISVYISFYSDISNLDSIDTARLLQQVVYVPGQPIMFLNKQFGQNSVRKRNIFGIRLKKVSVSDEAIKTFKKSIMV